MLEADKEYIVLVSKYLTPKQLVWWVKQDSSDWNVFYCFFEKQAKEACRIQVLQNTALGCKQQSLVKKKCIHCSGDRSSKNCKSNRTNKVDRPKGRLQLAMDSSGKGICKVCGLEAHTWFSKKQQKTFPDHWVASCPKFKTTRQSKARFSMR